VVFWVRLRMGKTRIKTAIRTEGLGSVTWRYCWLCLTEGDKTMGKNCEKNLGLVNCKESVLVRQGLGGSDSKNGGGGGRVWTGAWLKPG
jgi:hypothetical protein